MPLLREKSEPLWPDPPLPVTIGPLRRSLRMAFLGTAFLSCWLASYVVEPQKFLYARSWSFADPFCGLLFVVVVVLLITGHFRIDPPARWMFVYICAFFISIAGNNTWDVGGTLNFFRTAVFGLTLYVLARNCLCSAEDVGPFHLMCAVLGVAIALQGIFVVFVHWGEKFTNLLPVMGNMANLMNAWGFVLVMCFTVAIFWWGQSLKSVLRAAVCGVLGIGIALSLSRTAYTCLALVLFLAVIGRRLKKSVKLAFLALAIGGFMWVTISQLSKNVPDATKFLEIKFDNYQADLIDTRFNELTIQPLLEWQEQTPEVWMIGDGMSEKHNLFINCFWMTGIIGALAMLAYEASLFRVAARLRRSTPEVAHAMGLTLLALVTIMFLDDFLTNLRNHSATVAYVFAVLAGCLSSDIVGQGRWGNHNGRIWFLVKKWQVTPRGL
jgi:hypothetical protein